MVDGQWFMVYGKRPAPSMINRRAPFPHPETPFQPPVLSIYGAPQAMELVKDIHSEAGRDALFWMQVGPP